MALDFNSGVDFVDQNTRFMDDLYYNSESGKAWFDNWQDWLDTNLSTALSNYTIPAGKVVEAGVFDGRLYSLFQSIFGADRCVGFDIVSYFDDTSGTVIYGDIRQIHADHPMDIAVIYSGLGTWEHQKTSKEAGLQYAINNLVTGGLYLEPKTPRSIERMSQVSELEFLEFNQGRLGIYRKL